MEGGQPAIGRATDERAGNGTTQMELTVNTIPPRESLLQNEAHIETYLSKKNQKHDSSN
jgi:hypothetical protein